ncbi:uncharacterized protein LOC129287975 [Prosopis cineraria]|uniref:uncharacterized protein LOC129287975 n=1 Tax=Prosopis cineraria TaxID=364024 RepID=UPI0024106E21|nr:uncharacterized protein LOC129287975 [Prosopis cineraria]
MDCNAVEAIFDVGPMSTRFSFALERLALDQLPNLEHVWNEDPKEILSFQCLQKVYIEGCSSLKSLFPASMAQGKLESLGELEVKNCEQLVEIVAGKSSFTRQAYFGFAPQSHAALKLREIGTVHVVFLGLMM